MSSIYDLCKKYTQLMDSDIEILIDFEKFLPLFSEAQDCDVFIDCSTSDSNAAIVVAEYRPENSLYNNSVVGMYAERKNEPAALRTLETGMPTRGLKGLNQENKAIIQNVSAIRNEKNEVIGVFIMERDETEVFNKEFSMDENTALRNQISNYESNITITKYLDDAIIYFNDEGTAIYSNPKANKLFKELGYRDRLIGMRFHNLVYGDIKLNDIIKRNYIEINRYPIGNGVYKIKYYTIYDKDTKLGIAMILNDLTDIHKIEKELILKTVDIKEIHHRVKNNLQTIASLLRLQERRLNESEEKKILRENINRIISIALTHEILAQNGEDEVSIKEIIERLITYISQASLPSNSKITTSVLGDDFLLKSDTATSISLVVNELVQNSFEHAFKTSLEGNIEVLIKKRDSNACITVKDNGMGFNPDEVNKNSLGLVIVRSVIIEKLNGNINIDSTKDGTKVVLNFWF